MSRTHYLGYECIGKKKRGRSVIYICKVFCADCKREYLSSSEAIRRAKIKQYQPRCVKCNVANAFKNKERAYDRVVFLRRIKLDCLTQREIAGEIGISQSYLNRLIIIARRLSPELFQEWERNWCDYRKVVKIAKLPTNEQKKAWRKLIAEQS